MMAGRAQERGDDAEDHAPRPDQKDREQPPDRQDAANYDKAKGRDALNIEDVDSSNDEGAA